MSDKQIFTATDFAGIYKEIAEVIGIEATITLHDNFQGQQITLPKKLFAKDFIFVNALLLVVQMFVKIYLYGVSPFFEMVSDKYIMAVINNWTASSFIIFFIVFSFTEKS